MRSERGLMSLVLVAAAGLLLLCGFACMFGVQSKIQYVLPAPDASEEAQALTLAYDRAQRLLTGMGDALETPAIAARAQGCGIQRADGGEHVEATLYAVGEGFFDLEHIRLLEGRLIAPFDIANAQRVILLCSEAALRLFRSESPVGQTVLLGDEPYRVVGVVKGGRQIGEAGACRAYLPITAADALEMDTLEIAAKDTGITAAAAFESTMRAWRGDGTFYRFDKLKMGAWLPLRWVLVLMAVRLAAAVWAGIARYARESVRVYRERLAHSYAVALLPGMAGRACLTAMMCAALAAMAYGIALAASQPLYGFGEWVPSVFVDLSSLLETFWNLNDLNAAGIRAMSRDACRMELASGLIRWGTGCAVTGLLCGRRTGLKERGNERC